MLTRTLGVIVALLAAFAVHQYNQIGDLRRELENQRANGIVEARTQLVKSMEGQGGEMQRAIAWLHDYYKSADGLQRPEGLWISGHPDFEGLGVWIFDRYLTRRLQGDTEEQARQVVVDAIKTSDEWRTKHP